MLNEGYLQDLIARRECLGLGEGYIDEDNIIYIQEGNICFNLTNYVMSYKETYIDIPDIFYAVFIDISSSVWNQLVPYQFIFPKGVSYVGKFEDYEDSKAGSVSFGRKDNYNVKFTHSTFDFTRCIKLVSVADYCFEFMQIDKILFKDLAYIGVCGFNNLTINTLYFGHVGFVRNHAFLDTKVKNIRFDKGVDNLESGSFLFSECANVEEIVFNKLSIFGSGFYSNIKRVYLPYHIYGKNIRLQAGLEEITYTLSKGEILVQEAFDKLDELVTKVKKEVEERWELSDLEAYLYDYYIKNNKTAYQDILEILTHFILACKSTDTEIYLYDKYSYTDVHDRRYRNLIKDYKMDKVTFSCFIEI